MQRQTKKSESPSLDGKKSSEEAESEREPCQDINHFFPVFLQI